ncbi:MAG TPA: hypothetical protein VMU14_00095, partial [Acidimicrobiales bacterium]|nr:hypothetical protein [Acidimicrobiales bacterium]
MAAIVAVWTVTTGGSLRAEGGCAYDGESYCAMAAGHRGAAPFNRRVLEPALVRLLHFGSLTARFRAVDLAALAVIAGVTGALTRRVASAAGATPQRGSSAAVVSAAMVVMVPTMLHLALFLPVQTDLLAAALGLTTIAALVSNRPRAWRVAPVLAALTVLTREAWILPLLAGAVAAFPDRRRPAGATAAASVAAAAIALAQPSAGRATSDAAFAHAMLHFYLHAPGELVVVGWLALLPTGLAALLIVRAARTPGGWSWPVRNDCAVRVCLAVAAAHLAQSVIAGSDISRIATPASPLLWAVALGCVAGRPAMVAEPALALAGSVVMWEPFRVLAGSTPQYLSFFMPEYVGSQAQPLGRDLMALAVVAAGWL